MPHRRKARQEFSPQLVLDLENSFLYLGYSEESTDRLLVPLDTLAMLFLLRFTDIHSKVNIRLMKTNSSTLQAKYMVSIMKSSWLPAPCPGPQSHILACPPPFMYLPLQQTTIAGLCSVARYTLRLSDIDSCVRLLGFQKACLAAPREVSPWTDFCEHRAPLGLDELVHEGESECLPEMMSIFEAHLKQPVRMHNIRRRMQADTKDKEVTGQSNDPSEDPIHSYARRCRVFAEGPEVLLSDVLLYPVFHLLASKYCLLPSQEFPSIGTWLEALREQEGLEGVMQELVGTQEQDLSYTHLPPSPILSGSLYLKGVGGLAKKSEPKVKDFSLIDSSIHLWESGGLPNSQSSSLPSDLSGDSLDWSSLPPLVHPKAGDLPQDRLQRKCSQLESLARPIRELATRKSAGAVIVDFCSGGGHLGLLLAYLLPEHKVHLVENKEESMARARQRGLEMGLSNIWFFQSNLDFYLGKFSVGVSLHACGLATDLVLGKCAAAGADFVSCPCCYGAVNNTPVLSLPRAAAVRQHLDQEQFKGIGQQADMQGGRGQQCMDLVDTDRALRAAELGYTVHLAKLQPPDCTPKNNLLVGIFS